MADHIKYMVVYVPLSISNAVAYRSTISVSYVTDYEQDEYDLVSRKRFDTEEEAQKYGRKLALEHGLKMKWKQSGILDEDDEDE